MALVTKLRKLHKKCSYVELLRHYCPVEVLMTTRLHDTKLTIKGSAFILQAGMEEERTSAER